MRQRNTLEIVIVAPLDDGIIRKRLHDIRRDSFAAGKVDHLHIPAVHAEPEQQNFKIRGGSIPINTAF